MKSPVWVVKEVQPRPDYTLLLTFADGSQRLYNATPLLQKPLYADLRNISFFLSAKAECGTVIWNDEIDLAPEHLYENSVPVCLIADA